MSDDFRYAGKRYRLELAEGAPARVFQKKRQGLVELHGVNALRVLSAYRRKVLGEAVAERPRTYAKRRKPFRCSS